MILTNLLDFCDIVVFVKWDCIFLIAPRAWNKSQIISKAVDLAAISWSVKGRFPTLDYNPYLISAHSWFLFLLSYIRLQSILFTIFSRAELRQG